MQKTIREDWFQVHQSDTCTAVKKAFYVRVSHHFSFYKLWKTSEIDRRKKAEGDNWVRKKSSEINSCELKSHLPLFSTPSAESVDNDSSRIWQCLCGIIAIAIAQQTGKYGKCTDFSKMIAAHTVSVNSHRLFYEWKSACWCECSVERLMMLRGPR